MTPRKYAAMPHPLVMPYIRARAQPLAAPVQTLSVPQTATQALHLPDKAG